MNKENEGVGVTMENAIKYFKSHCKIFCDDFMKKIPEDSVAYQATLKEKEFYDLAIKALEKEPCEDAVSREAVIKVAKDWWGNGVLAIDDIYKLPPVKPTQKWIPCSERLPEVGERVLCQCQANIYEVLKLTVDGWYHDNKHCYMSGFVIAWMPLPDLYNTEMEGEE
jgi:hypothetical protein